MLEMGHVKLGEQEGQGYAFTRRTAFGKACHGVFFARDEETIDQLKDQEQITFTGPVYYRRRSGSYRRKEEELTVNVVNSTSTPMGERIDFESVENPDEVDEPPVVRSR